MNDGAQGQRRDERAQRPRLSGRALTVNEARPREERRPRPQGEKNRFAGFRR